MRLSKNFTLAELTKSQTAERLGIDNSLAYDTEQALSLSVVCERLLEPIRSFYGNKPFSPSSAYRGYELEGHLCRKALDKFLDEDERNQPIHYLEKKAHPKGEAVDLELPGINNLDLAEWIRDNLHFDQLILEFYEPDVANSGWVHVSYRRDGKNRNQVLTIGSAGTFSRLPDFEGE
jgi:zinc D-Ala-D-Ala carboxypeptidase